MINFLFTAGLALLLVLALADARVIYRLNRRCLQIEAQRRPIPGLLRWYTEAFVDTQRLARGLLLASCALLLLAILVPADPWLIAICAASTALMALERRYSSHCRRCHLLAQGLRPH